LKGDVLDIVNVNWRQITDKVVTLEEKVIELKESSENAFRTSKLNSTQIDSIFRTNNNSEDKTYKNECDIKTISSNKLD